MIVKTDCETDGSFYSTSTQYFAVVLNNICRMPCEKIFCYFQDAMNNHGLGHLPQPDNFTTCGRLGIEINQVNIAQIFLHKLSHIFTH